MLPLNPPASRFLVKVPPTDPSSVLAPIRATERGASACSRLRTVIAARARNPARKNFHSHNAVSLKFHDERQQNGAPEALREVWPSANAPREPLSLISQSRLSHLTAREGDGLS